MMIGMKAFARRHAPHVGFDDGYGGRPGREAEFGTALLRRLYREGHDAGSAAREEDLATPAGRAGLRAAGLA